MDVDLEGLKIVTDDKLELHLFNHEYWTLLPTGPIPLSGPKETILSRCGIAAHNIKIGQGLLIAKEDLLNGIEPTYFGKGPRKRAEDTLEEMRKEFYPNKPSRLEAHFLFHNEQTAKSKQKEWGMQDRHLTRCYVALNSARFHYADVNLFDALVNAPQNTELAKKYWEEFKPESEDEKKRLEVLADSNLYFPDWENIPTVHIV